MPSHTDSSILNVFFYMHSSKHGVVLEDRSTGKKHNVTAIAILAMNRLITEMIQDNLADDEGRGETPFGSFNIKPEGGLSAFRITAKPRNSKVEPMNMLIHHEIVSGAAKLVENADDDLPVEWYNTSMAA